MQGAQTITTKQNDTTALKDERLEAVVGGYELKNVQVVSAVKRMRSRSNRTFSYTECDEKGGS